MLTLENQPQILEDAETQEPLVRRRSMSDTDIEPIYLGVDFGALLRLRGSIASQDTLWIDMWQHFPPGKTVVPLDDQYLSCLTAFKNLRCLWVTGMLKSYQKSLFQAIWKMEHLANLQLRMAEEPRLSPEGERTFRPIEPGWSPIVNDDMNHDSP